VRLSERPLIRFSFLLFGILWFFFSPWKQNFATEIQNGTTKHLSIKFLSLNSLTIILSADFIYRHAPENDADKRHAIHTEHIINNNWLILFVVHFQILSVFQAHIALRVGLIDKELGMWKEAVVD